MISYLKNIICPVVALVFAVLVFSCSTGIESTKTIRMSKSEKRDAKASEEELLASRISSQKLSEWSIGKQFLVTDDKASLLLHSSSGSAPLKGKVIKYAGFDVHPTPGGEDVAFIEFRDPAGSYFYNTGRDADKASELTGADMPMMIDLDMVDQANVILSDMKVWTATSLWYDDSLTYIRGRKYVPVTIHAVRPGNMVFPMIVDFEDDKGTRASMLMNMNGSGSMAAENRTFSSLFALSDPKLKYPAILPEVWERICNGQVAEGMTKDECRLALGKPADVNTGSNWNQVVDVWRYRDGTFLQFRDGLLVNFRH